MHMKLPLINILDCSSHHRRGSDLQSFEQSYEAEITNVYPLTANEKLYQLSLIDPEARERFTFRPGQFVMLEIPGIGEGPFSISSSSIRHGDLELCIRRAGNLTNFLDRAKRGTRASISGPFGTSFPVERMHGENIVLVAGGLGIVPLRAPLLSVLEHRNRYRRVEVIYGAKSPAELLFAYEYEMWRKFDIELSLIVEKPDSTWTGQTGLITKALEDVLRNASKTFSQHTFAIVCGPPVMFKFVCRDLIAAGLPMQKIFVSLERRMHCGRGKCCRCNIGSTYTCLDGPVFDYWSVMNLKEAI